MQATHIRTAIGGTALVAVVVVLVLSAFFRERRVQGVFTYGFEVMSFQPCGSNERWWVAEGSQAILHFHEAPPSPSLERHLVTLYAEVRGRISARGHYGHLGAYTRSLSVKQVLVVSETIPSSCQ